MSAQQHHSTATGKKRRRPAKSCVECRERKVRCDLGEPCGPCSRSRASLICTYICESAGQEPPEVVRTARHETQHERQRPQGDAKHVGPSALPRHLRNPITKEQSRLQVSDAPSQLQESCANSDAGRLQPRYAPQSVERRTGNVPDLAIPPLPHRLRITNDKVKLFGPTHWMHTAQRFPVTSDFQMPEQEIPAGTPLAELKEQIHEVRRKRHLIRARQEAALADPATELLDTFPPRAVCDDLLSLYLRTFEGIYRIVHLQTFMPEYEIFWEDPAISSTAFRVHLALILAIGTTFYPDREGQEHLRRQTRVWITAAQWWLTGPATAKATLFSLYGVRIACLHLLARQVTEMGTSSWVGTDIALRLAMSIGLHRDPDVLPVVSKHDLLHTELRRRLWYSTVELTLQANLGSATAFILSIDQFDTKPPRNLLDRQLRNQDEQGIGEVSEDHLTDVSIQRMLQKSLSTRLQVAALLNSFKHDHSHKAAIDLGNELKTVCRDIAVKLRSFEQQWLDGPLKPSKFHAQFLDMGIRRLILLLHRPFFLQARNDPRFHYSRSVCFETSMLLASYADVLNLPTEPADDFARLLITIRGPINAPLSLDAVTMLGLEIVTQLQEDGAGPNSTADPANTLARANRQPVVRILNHIKNQHLEIVARGSPRMKRYVYLLGILAQTQALEDGQNASHAMVEALRECVPKLDSLLEAMLQRSEPTDTLAKINEMPSLPDTDDLVFDLDGLFGPGFDLGFGELNQFPGNASPEADLEW